MISAGPVRIRTQPPSGEVAWEAVALTENDIKEGMGDLYDRITFYRTIQTLLDAEIIHRITINSKTIKYALNEESSHGENHSHFFCEKCHAVTCLEDTTKFDYQLPKGYTVHECEILIKGTCTRCGKEKDNALNE